MSKIITFGKECFAELRKVVWPTRDDVVSAVKVVIVSTILVAVFLEAPDYSPSFFPIYLIDILLQL